MNFLNRTWAEIDLDRLDNNFNIIKNALSPSTKVLCVVKANAYGHGAVEIARHLENRADYFAVSNIEEAVELRRAEIKKPILILGYTPADFAKELNQYDIIQTLTDYDYAVELNKAAKSLGVKINCHIKVDTGMNRLGFEYDDKRLIDVCRFDSLCVEGIFTHFASADKDGDQSGEFTALQFERFRKAISLVEDSGYKFKIKHCCNSAATLQNKDYHLDMVRAGIMLYGLAPSNDVNIDGFKPVMTLKTIVSMVKKLHKGECVSYGRTFTADKEMTVATLPVGYADGYIRAFAKGGEVLVNKHTASLVGRICMDQCVADVSGIDVKVGDTVTLFGYDQDTLLPVDRLSALAGTINYETVCLITHRVGRKYIKNGNEIGWSSLLTDRF